MNDELVYCKKSHTKVCVDDFGNKYKSNISIGDFAEIYMIQRDSDSELTFLLYINNSLYNRNPYSQKEFEKYFTDDLKEIRKIKLKRLNETKI